MNIRRRSSEKSLFLTNWMNESLPGRDYHLSCISKVERHHGSKVQNACVSLPERPPTTATTTTTTTEESDRCCCHVSDDNVVSKDVFAHQQATKTDGTHTNTPHMGKTCRHSREKEELKSRNMELERQLQEARRTIRAHEERLLVYSQMINSHSLALDQNLAACPGRPPVGHFHHSAAVSVKNYYNANRCGKEARAVDSLSSGSTLNSLNSSGNYSDFFVVPR